MGYRGEPGPKGLTLYEELRLYGDDEVLRNYEWILSDLQDSIKRLETLQRYLEDERDSKDFRVDVLIQNQYAMMGAIDVLISEAKDRGGDSSRYSR